MIQSLFFGQTAKKFAGTAETANKQTGVNDEFVEECFQQRNDPHLVCKKVITAAGWCVWD